ncbi:MAG: hypothetical protein NC086_03370 [Alistipes sp.]|nr:hypothetical protein [Alistipes sp.]
MDNFDLKGLYPAVPTVVHERLRSVVEEQTNTKGNKRRAGGKRFYKKVLVVSLAVVMVLGMTAVAADEIFHLRVEQKGYQAEIVGEMEKVLDEAFEGHAYIALKFGYLPEGIVPDQPSENIYADPGEISAGIVKFHDENGEGISPFIMKTGESDVLAQIKSTDNVTEYSAGGKRIYIINQMSAYPEEEKAFVKQGYVFFDACNYYAGLGMTAGISDEDAVKILENCVLEGIDESAVSGMFVVAKKDVVSWREDEIKPVQTPKTETDREYLFCNFKKPGETAEYRAGFTAFDFTLNSYEYIDNINDFPDRDKFIYDLKEEWFDEDGRILPRHVQLVRPGDGIHSVNEIIGERDVPVKLLVANFTMEIKGKYGSEAIQVAPYLYLDGKEPKPTPEGVYEQGDTRGSSEGMPIYNEICADNVKQILFADLKEGDVVTYNVIYIVDEEDINHVGLVLHRVNTNLAFDLRGE